MGVLTDTIVKNNRDIINEVEKITKTLERNEKNETLNTNTKQLLKGALTEYATNYFVENKGDFIDTTINKCKTHFEILANRNEIIKQIGTNQLEYNYLNDIYDGIINKIHRQFTKDFLATWATLPLEEKERVQDINTEKSIEKWAPVFQMARQHNKKAKKLLAKDERKETNKHSFITFLNIIFSLWD